MDFGISGIDPEPRGGYKSKQQRDHELERFSNAVWQRHEVGAHARSVHSWPNAFAYEQNWPGIALNLIIADWQIAGAAAAEHPLVEEIELDKLLPRKSAAHDWKQLYDSALERHPELEQLLNREQSRPGDNIELVLERAALTSGERAVLRPLLYGLELREVAHDLSWRIQTTQILLNNALDRLSFWLERQRAQHEIAPRGVVGGRTLATGRESDRALQRAAAQSV